MRMFMCNYVHRSVKCHQRLQEGARFSGAGVLGAYVTPLLGDRTWVLYKNSAGS